MAKYKVLGVEGGKVIINGVEYPSRQEERIELTDEEAARSLSEGTIELCGECNKDEDIEESEEEEVEGDEEVL